MAQVFVENRDAAMPMFRKWSLRDLKELEVSLRNWHGELADDRFVLFYLDMLVETTNMRENIVIVDPLNVGVCVAATSRDRGCEALRESLEATRALYDGPVKLVIVPLNYSVHWSLLVYFAHSDRWYHYDSIPGSSHRSYAKRFLDICHTGGILHGNLTRAHTQIDDTPVISVQQEGWECGTYMLMYVMELVRNYSTGFAPLCREDESNCNNARMYRHMWPWMKAVLKIARDNIR